MSTTYADELKPECAKGHPPVPMILSSAGDTEAEYQCPTCFRKIEVTKDWGGGFDLEEVDKDGAGKDNQLSS